MEDVFDSRPSAGGEFQPAGVKDRLRQGDCVQFKEGRESITGRILDIRRDAVLLEYHNGRFRLARQVAFARIQRILSSSACAV